MSLKKSLNPFRRKRQDPLPPTSPTNGTLEPPPPDCNPPPYTDVKSLSIFDSVPSTVATSSAPPSHRDAPSAQEDKYKALANFDTLFLIDDSGSMWGSNWEQTSQALSAIVPICTKYDSDGVDIYFLNNETPHKKVRSAEEVFTIFKKVSPYGTTPTGGRLGEILEAYFQLYRLDRSAKPLNIIIITDGEPSDPKKLEDNIVKYARELDSLKAKDRQVGIQFFQVGSDEGATDALEDLDNALVEEYGIRDMVDTVSWKKMEGKGLTGEGMLKAVLGAVDKQLDRKRAR
ncbi:hypothetical protein RUND412_004632 [Rhizina undulata]